MGACLCAEEWPSCSIDSGVGLFMVVGVGGVP